MKTCPKCGELIGNDVNECFNCHYNYTYGRVMNSSEIMQERDKAQQAIEKRIMSREVREKKKQLQLQKNPQYEYEVVLVNDLDNGEADLDSIQRVLSEYAEQGWKLHSMITNEIGKNSTNTVICSLGIGINATVDQMVIVFERCIDAGDQ